MPLDAMKLQTFQSVGTAASPEEAFKIFAGLASQHIGDAIAKSLAEAVGAVSSATAASSNPIAGWEGYVKGLCMDMNWGTPGHTYPPTILNIFSREAVSDPAAPMHIKGTEISIGITTSF